MSVYQPTPRRSASKGAALGRRLNATRTVSPLTLAVVMAATVEIENEERDIIARPGKYGVLYLLRSNTVPGRYFPVSYKDGQYEFPPCDKNTAYYLSKRIERYLQELVAA
jgi:hypothetical protein